MRRDSAAARERERDRQRGRAPTAPRRGAALLLGLLLGAALLAATPSPARADADPPSDVLLLQDVYYPYHPATAPRLRRQLDELAARARKAGFPIKVAIVAARADLGGVPLMFGKPALYARFLESEIRNNAPQPLLTVMPNGYGTFATGARGAALVAGLPHPSGPDSADAMARGALVAVERLAALNGHELDTKDLGTGKRGSHGSTPLVLVFAPLAVLALGVLVLSRRQRRGVSDDEQLPGLDSNQQPFG